MMKNSRSVTICFHIVAPDQSNKKLHDHIKETKFGIHYHHSPSNYYQQGLFSGAISSKLIQKTEEQPANKLTD